MPTVSSDRGKNVPQIDDSDSVKGRFSWEIVADTCVPCLLRNSGQEKYVPVSVGESKVLGRYLKHFTAELFECVVVQSFQLTTTEVALLNYINKEHCSLHSRRFTKEKEAIVRLQDFRQYYEFLDTCYRKLKQIALSDGQRNKCGFIRLNNESVVPYIVKDEVTYMPLFYFEGDTGTLGEQTINVRDWDLAYLKFCCKMQGIRNTIFSCDVCAMVSFDVIKKYFPEDTIFEDYWPVELHSRMLLSHSLREVSGNPWILSPIATPANTNPIANCSVINGSAQSDMNPLFPNGRHNNVSQKNQPPIPVQVQLGNSLPSRFPYPLNGIPNTPRTSAPNATMTSGNIYSHSETGNLTTNSAPRVPLLHHPSGPATGNGNLFPSQITPSSGGVPFSPHIMTPPHGGNPFPPQSTSRNLGNMFPPQIMTTNGGDGCSFSMKASSTNDKNSIPSSSQITSINSGIRLPSVAQIVAPRGPIITSNRMPSQPITRRAVFTSAPNSLPTATPVRLIRSLATNTMTNGHKDDNKKRNATDTNPNDVIDLISPPSSPGPVIVSDTNTANATEKTATVAPALVLLPRIDGTSYDITTTSVHGMKLCLLDTVGISSLHPPNPFILLNDIAMKFCTTVERLKYELQVVLKLTLYRANEEQQKLLFKHNKCDSLHEEVPLVLLSDLNSRFTHLQYLHKNENQKPKRMRH